MWRDDLLAGIPCAVSAVSDGMASAVVAGVSPVHGLYASFAGPIGGGLTQSTKRMVVTTTTAASLAAGSAVSGVASGSRADALILLTVIAGVLMVVAGLCKLGRYTRFVPHSVMIGFLTGVSVNIIFGQLPDLLGINAHGSTNLQKAIDALSKIGSIDWPTFITGLAAIAAVVLLAPTFVGSFASLIALIVPTLFVVIGGFDSVARVNDAGAIPLGIPIPALPHLSDLSVNVIVGAFSVAVIILVQGAGVAEATPNPDGSLSDVNRDFAAQGAGSILAGFFKGQPVGGSVGSSALNVASGAKTRWASIFGGLWMLLILAAFAGVVGLVAMPTLAAVLIVAAVQSFRIGNIWTIWRTSAISRVSMITTFLATLLLPVAIAVGIGVAVALLLQLNRDAVDLRVVRLSPDGDGRFREEPPPARLPDHEVTVLDVYGSLYYAGSKTLQARLPDATGSQGAAVVLRLRGRTAVGATFIVVLDDYIGRVLAGGGQVYLSGIDVDLFDQFARFDRFSDSPNVHVLAAYPLIGGSTSDAYEMADEWLKSAATPEPDAAS
jgi:SulP family sulfate permease